MLDQKCWSFCIVYKNIYFCVYMSGSRRGDIGRSVLCNKVFASPMPFKTNRQIMNLSPWIPVLSLPWLGGVHVRAWKSVYVCVSFIWCVKQHADRMMERSLGIFFFFYLKAGKKRKEKKVPHVCTHPFTPSHTLLSLNQDIASTFFACTSCILSEWGNSYENMPLLLLWNYH